MSYRAVLSSGLGSLSDYSWEGSWQSLSTSLSSLIRHLTKKPRLDWERKQKTMKVVYFHLLCENSWTKSGAQTKERGTSMSTFILWSWESNCWQVEHIQMLKLWCRDGKSEPQSAVNHMQLTLARFSGWYSTSSHGNLQINKHINKLNTRMQITNIYYSPTCGAVCRLLMVSVSPKCLLRIPDSATLIFHHLLYASRTCSSPWHHDIIMTSSSQYHYIIMTSPLWPYSASLS